MSSSSLSSVPALATTHSSDSFDHPSDWPDDVVRKLIRLFVYTNLPITLILEVLGRENLEEFANETIYYTLSDDPGWLRAAKLPDMDRRMTNLRARIEYVKQFRLDDNNAVPCDVDARPVEFDIDFLINPPQTNGMKSINLSRGIDKKLSPTSFLQQTQRFSKHYLSNIEWILRDDSTELGSHISTACFSFAPTVPGDKAWRALSQDGIILPSDFMHVDRLAGVCLEGKLSHDTGRCLCTVSGRREGRTSSSTGSRETLGAQAKTAKRPRTRSISGSSRLPPSLSICPNNGSDGDFLWVLPGGMTSEAQYLVQKDAEFAQDDLEYDIFGNSTLHFLAARAQPMVFFKALAVFGAVTELNSGDQTFLHCLGPQWFNVDNLRPLGTLLTFLRYIDFDVNARDVYGQSIFHIIAQRTHEPHTIPEHIARQYGFREFSCRDAFGLQPSPTTNTLKHLLTPDLGDREDKPSSIHTGSSDWSDFSDVKIIKNEHHNPHQGTADIDAAHTQLLALIAEASTNPEIEDSEGRNALHCLAIVSPPIGSMSSADTLSAAETDNDYAKHVKGPRERIQRRNMDLIIEEEFKWRLTTLERLLSGGVDVNAYNASGNTVLMEFVLHLPDYHDHNGTGSILYQLINFGAKLNARNRQGDTALHLAVCRGHKVAMATLVLSGAQVHARNRCLQSPLELVAGLISETQDDIQTYSNFEACYAWLSSETAGARLWSSFKDEWGESEHWACGRALPIVKRPAAAALEDALVTLKRDQEMDMAEVRQKGMDGLPEWSQWVDSDKREALSDTSTSSLTKSLIKKELSESPSSTRPPWRDRDTLVDDMCDHILSNAFSVTTEEICNPGDIWQSVQTCLNEVLAILSSDDTTRWQDIHIDAISPPCDSPSSDTPRTNSRQEAVTMPSSNSLGKRKLPGGGNSDDELGERNSDGNKNPGLNPSGVGPPEQKRAKACIRFGCPYRKRNPLRFNVREHLNCATQSFTDMAQLKRHVTTFHKRKPPPPTYTCTRCQMSFTTEQDRDGHLRVPLDQICAIQDKSEGFSSQEDPENGITPDVGDVLRDRRGHVQVLNWGVLWSTLFPGDDTVPPAEYEPVIDVYEVEHVFNQNADKGSVFVAKQMKKIQWHTEPAMSEDPASKIWDVFQSLTQLNFQDSKDKILNSYTTVARRKPRKRPAQADAMPTPSTSISSTPRPLRPAPWVSVQGGSSFHEASLNSQHVDHFSGSGPAFPMNEGSLDQGSSTQKTLVQIFEQGQSAWPLSEEAIESDRDMNALLHSQMTQSVANDSGLAESLGIDWCFTCQCCTPCSCKGDLIFG